MSNRTQSTLLKFLPQIKTQLVLNSVFDNADMVNYSLDSDFINLPGGNCYCLITPLEFASWQRSTDGGGVMGMILVGRVVLTIWSLNALDFVPTDNSSLLDPVLGLYTKVDNCITALQMFDPVAPNNLAEPMRLIDVSRPTRDPDHKDWVKVLITWECKIWQDVGQGDGCINYY